MTFHHNPTPHALPHGMNPMTRTGVRNAARLMGILAIAGCLAACGDDDHKADKDSQLVQGRDACIDTLVQAGRTHDDARDICDKALADATVKETGNGTYDHGGGGGGGYYYWYLINHNNTSTPPAVYRESGSGYAYVAGGRTSSYTPPASLDADRAAYLRTSPLARAAAARSSGSSSEDEEGRSTGSYRSQGSGSSPVAEGEEGYSSGGVAEESFGSRAGSFGSRATVGISRGGFGGMGVSMGG